MLNSFNGDFKSRRIVAQKIKTASKFINADIEVKNRSIRIGIH